MDFWDFFWLLIWTFVFVCYLMVLFQIIVDLFRDRDLSGWWKALWVILSIIFPFLAILIYLIARGKGMAERRAGETRALRPIRTSTSSPSLVAVTQLTRSHRRRICWIAAPLLRRKLTSSSRRRWLLDFCAATGRAFVTDLGGPGCTADTRRRVPVIRTSVRPHCAARCRLRGGHRERPRSHVLCR